MKTVMIMTMIMAVKIIIILIRMIITRKLRKPEGGGHFLLWGYSASQHPRMALFSAFSGLNFGQRVQPAPLVSSGD